MRAIMKKDDMKFVWLWTLIIYKIAELIGRIRSENQ